MKSNGTAFGTPGTIVSWKQARMIISQSLELTLKLVIAHLLVGSCDRSQLKSPSHVALSNCAMVTLETVHLKEESGLPYDILKDLYCPSQGTNLHIYQPISTCSEAAFYVAVKKKKNQVIYFIRQGVFLSHLRFLSQLMIDF